MHTTKKLILIITVFFSFYSNAENAFTIVDSTFSFELYPTIKFKFWTRSYLPLDTTKFVLQENEITQKTTIQDSPNNISKRLQTNKIIYILVENHYLPKGNIERTFFKKVLSSAIQGKIKPGDKIYIATFDWYRNGKYSYLQNEKSTDNENEVMRIISSITQPTKLSNQQTGADIYFALDEALKFLSNIIDTLPKNILLLSDDYPNIAGQKTAEEIRDASLKADIPIYAIGYNIGAGRYSQLTKDEICNNTNGAYFSIANNDLQACTNALISFFDNMNNYSDGKTYLISYVTNEKKNGKKNNIKILIKGKKATEANIKFPFHIVDWIKCNPILAFLILTSIIILIGIIILLYQLYNKKQNQKILLEQENNIQLQQTQQEVNRLKQNQLNTHQNIIIQSNNIEIENKSDQLLKLMQLKNIFPRVTYDNVGQTGEFIIDKPDFNIGRDKSTNSFTIDAASVSRNHALISFDENMQFTITDLNSTNGITINGFKIKSAILKNTDIIKLGDVLLKINL